MKTSAQRVIAATNSWLHSQTRRSQYPYDMDKGYVCTLSAMVIKSDHRAYLSCRRFPHLPLQGNSLEQLTNDHRVIVSSEQSYLSRAMGANPQIEIDYQALQVEKGDVFLLTTDGVHEYAATRFIARAIQDGANDLDAAARTIVEEAYSKGSADNLTVQIVRIDELPDGRAGEAAGHASALPLPPLLEARMTFDGYTIVREVHGSSRSHLYLAIDIETGTQVILKIPSIDLREDTAYLRRFMMEEWVARRINSAHVLKPSLQSRKRNFLYIVTEFIEGQTLTQWMIDNPKPDLETVRGIIEQIARGLRAFHRMEMLHQDVRPDNIMIDRNGTVKIIDFGSTKVAGVVEAAPADRDDILGTFQYTAPEYFLGEAGSSRSDLFSLGVITYQMLTGRLPYGAQVARTRTKAQQRRMTYASACDFNLEVPLWVDDVLQRAVHPDPYKRYEVLSEYLHDLRHPKENYNRSTFTPLMERNPLVFWKVLSLILGSVVLFLLFKLRTFH